GMPPGIVLAAARDADPARAFSQLVQPSERSAHLALIANDADESLHHILEVVLNLEGSFRARAGGNRTLERLERLARRLVNLALIDFAARAFFRIDCGVLAGTLAEDQQIRQRVAAEPV